MDTLAAWPATVCGSEPGGQFRMCVYRRLAMVNLIRNTGKVDGIGKVLRACRVQTLVVVARQDLLPFSFPTVWVPLLARQQCFACGVLAAVKCGQGRKATRENALLTS
jgi:hypothetical protein